MTDTSPLTQGYIYPFLLKDSNARGSIIRLGQEFQDIIQKHQYPTCINNILGELCVLGISLVGDIKIHGILTLQITQGALVSMVVAEVTSEGHIRGCATFEEDALHAFLQTNPHPTFQDLFHGGQFIITTRFEHTAELQQAIIEVTGDTLSQCIEHYFTQSAQIPTAIQIFAQAQTYKTDTGDDQARVVDIKNRLPIHQRSPFLVGGMILQQLPQSTQDQQSEQSAWDSHSKTADHADTWNTLGILLHSLKDEELLSPTISPDMLLHRLFHEYETIVFAPKEIQFKCSCSKDRLLALLKNFDEPTRAELTVDEEIVANCHFCSSIYTFSKNDLDSQ